MDWVQVLTIVGANIVLIASALGITITLFIHSDNKMEAHRKETQEILKGIQQEMKDFHNRLFSLEERYKKEIYKA